MAHEFAERFLVIRGLGQSHGVKRLGFFQVDRLLLFPRVNRRLGSEGLGRHFFRMDFAEADRLSATTDNQFIMDLMPRYPIYVDLIPTEAREVIGRCHSDGVGAYKLLQWEGFEFDRTVDIFDGGPLVAAQRRHIRTIQESRVLTVEVGDTASDPEARQGLLSRRCISRRGASTLRCSPAHRNHCPGRRSPALSSLCSRSCSTGR